MAADWRALRAALPPEHWVLEAQNANLRLEVEHWKRVVLAWDQRRYVRRSGDIRWE